MSVSELPLLGTIQTAMMVLENFFPAIVSLLFYFSFFKDIELGLLIASWFLLLFWLFVGLFGKPLDIISRNTSEPETPQTPETPETRHTNHQLAGPGGTPLTEMENS